MKNTFCYVAVRTGLEPVTPCVTGMYSNQAELTHRFINLSKKWVVMDSNHRRRKPADLQSAPFGHSGNHPLTVSAASVAKEVTPAGFKPTTF